MPRCRAPRRRAPITGRAGTERPPRPVRRSRYRSRLAGRCPSGQREQTVNLPAQPTKVRILPGPLFPLLPGSHPGFCGPRSRTCPGAGVHYNAVTNVSDAYPPGPAEGEAHRVRAPRTGAEEIGARADTMGLMGRTAASVRGFDPSAVPVVGRVLDRLTIWDEAVRRRWPFSALVGPDLEPGAVDGDGSRLLVRPAILGFIAVTAITPGSIPPALALRVEAPRRVVLRRPHRRRNRIARVPLPRPGRRLRRPRAVHARLVRLDPDPLAAEGGAGPQARDGPRPVDRPAAAGTAAVQPGHLQLRRPGRDDEPPHQPVPLRPRCPRRRPVRGVGRPPLDQHARALRAAIHADRRDPHERLDAPRARRPGAAAAPGRPRRGPHGPVDPVPGPQPRTRSVLRLHGGRAQPGHDPPSGGRRPQRRPHARPAHVRPGRGAPGETGGGHRVVRIGRGREGPGRARVSSTSAGIGWAPGCRCAPGYGRS